MNIPWDAGLARTIQFLLLPVLFVACLLVATGHLLTVIAAVICLVTLLPLLNRQPLDMFSPWTYLFYFVVLNIFVRSVFIDFAIGGDDFDISRIFYMDKPDGFLIESTVVMLVGFVFLTLGYLIPASKPRLLGLRIFRSGPVARRRFNRMIAFMIIISGVSLVAFIYVTFTGFGDFAIGMLSRHRGLTTDLSEYRAHGYLRLLIGLASIVVYLAYARLRTTGRHDRRYLWTMFIVGTVITLTMSFYSQSRGALIFIFLNIVFMKYYLDGRRFPWKVLSILAPIILALFFVTSAFRGGSGVSLNQEITAVRVVAPIILNNGGIDASKTGHIIDYVDASQDYKFGQTLVQFIWAAVPRGMWTSKPVNLDTYIGEKVYGAETYGASAVPPGFFAEMYMNFWYGGIVLGAFLLGMFMKYLANLLAGNRHNVNFIVCYVVTLQSIGMSVLASGVSSTIMGVLMSGIPLVIALNFVTPAQRRPVAVAPGGNYATGPIQQSSLLPAHDRAR